MGNRGARVRKTDEDVKQLGKAGQESKSLGNR